MSLINLQQLRYLHNVRVTVLLVGTYTVISEENVDCAYWLTYDSSNQPSNMRNIFNVHMKKFDVHAIPFTKFVSTRPITSKEVSFAKKKKKTS